MGPIVSLLATPLGIKGWTWGNLDHQIILKRGKYGEQISHALTISGNLTLIFDIPFIPPNC